MSSLGEVTVESVSVSPEIQRVSAGGAKQRITNGEIQPGHLQGQIHHSHWCTSGSTMSENEIHVWRLRSEVREDASFFADWGAGRRDSGGGRLRQPQNLWVKTHFLPFSLQEEDNKTLTFYLFILKC